MIGRVHARPELRRLRLEDRMAQAARELEASGDCCSVLGICAGSGRVPQKDNAGLYATFAAGVLFRSALIVLVAVFIGRLGFHVKGTGTAAALDAGAAG